MNMQVPLVLTLLLLSARSAADGSTCPEGRYDDSRSIELAICVHLNMFDQTHEDREVTRGFDNVRFEIAFEGEGEGYRIERCESRTDDDGIGRCIIGCNDPSSLRTTVFLNLLTPLDPPLAEIKHNSNSKIEHEGEGRHWFDLKGCRVAERFELAGKPTLYIEFDHDYLLHRKVIGSHTPGGH